MFGHARSLLLTRTPRSMLISALAVQASLGPKPFTLKVVRDLNPETL